MCVSHLEFLSCVVSSGDLPDLSGFIVSLYFGMCFDLKTKIVCFRNFVS